jgi:hypothetical protein
MRRTLVVGLSVLLLLGGVAAAALLLSNGDRAPLPSEDQLRTSGFAVWPEDTVAEGLDACRKAEPWRLDPSTTALRFVREVLRYPEPYLNDMGVTPTKVRYLIGTRGVRGVFLGSVVDLVKHDRCWFVVEVQPREEGWPATVSFVDRSGGPHLVIKSTGERTEVGYGSWQQSVVGREQVLLDLQGVEPDATGHVISLVCGRVCDASAWTLGYVPEPATTEVAPLDIEELTHTPGICRIGFHSQLKALVELYAMTVEKPTGVHNGKPMVGNVMVKGLHHLHRVGIKPLGGNRWSLTAEGADLEARVIPVNRCWSITSIDDTERDLLRSLHVDDESITFDLRWGGATSAIVTLSNRSGAGRWHFQRLSGPITLTGISPQVLEEPFNLSILLRDGRTTKSHESSWYRGL